MVTRKQTWRTDKTEGMRVLIPVKVPPPAAFKYNWLPQQHNIFTRNKSIKRQISSNLVTWHVTLRRTCPGSKLYASRRSWEPPPKWKRRWKYSWRIWETFPESEKEKQEKQINKQINKQTNERTNKQKTQRSRIRIPCSQLKQLRGRFFYGRAREGRSFILLTSSPKWGDTLNRGCLPSPLPLRHSRDPL